MTEIVSWLTANWGDVAAYIGIGGGSGIAAKKFTDKKQDTKIGGLENKILAIDKELIKIKGDIEKNTQFDKQFREQTEKEYHGIKKDMDDIKRGVDRILGHLLNSKK